MARADTSNEVMKYSFNGDTTDANYRSSGTFRGGGSATAYWAPDTRYIQRSTGPSNPSGFFGANVCTIIDYARTTKTKIMLAETAGALDGAGNYAMFATSLSGKILRQFTQYEYNHFRVILLLIRSSLYTEYSRRKMPSTYAQIATYTIPSATASYTFTSIPDTYTDFSIGWRLSFYEWWWRRTFCSI
jgi:hypothetical protein